MIKERNGRYPSGNFTLAATCPPSRLESIATWEEGSPRLAQKISYNDDESSLDRYLRWFELGGGSACNGIETIMAQLDH